ncbi:hypothetical protein [Croceicoccus marinus]|uniref:hypothetical protein n=1 Tax=Croceicoccus marinus TaxID=450378 RepID=UPI000AB69082|nr:hypothetical protein [Croceicoccus marinus]
MTSGHGAYDKWLAKINLDEANWSHRAKCLSKNGQIEEGWFWRFRGMLSDSELIEKSFLQNIEGKGLYHIVHIPWIFPDGTAGKSDWSQDEWDFLNEALSETFNYSGGFSSEYEFKYLCIDRPSLSHFQSKNISHSYFKDGLTSHDLNNSQVSKCFINNYATGFKFILDCVVDGDAKVEDADVRIDECYIRNFVFSGHKDARRPLLEISESEITTIYISGKFSDLFIDDLICESFDISNSSFKHGTFTGEKSSIILNAENCYFENRVIFTDISLGIDITRNSSFRHAVFADKLIFDNVEVFFSCLSDIQLGGPIDLDLRDRSLEAGFARELSQLQSLKEPAYSESLRNSLERACQIICERNRQDGRKDLEKRFRRMELMARTASEHTEPSTKFINWFYREFSDFGFSWWRPLLGLVLSWFFLEPSIC